MEPDARTEKLLKKASERKASETFDQTSQRVGDVLDRRNKVMDKVEEYQKKHGEPTKEEADENFLKNEVGMDISMDELEKFAEEE